MSTTACAQGVRCVYKFVQEVSLVNTCNENVFFFTEKKKFYVVFGNIYLILLFLIRLDKTHIRGYK